MYLPELVGHGVAPPGGVDPEGGVQGELHGFGSYYERSVPFRAAMRCSPALAGLVAAAALAVGGCGGSSAKATAHHSTSTAAQSTPTNTANGKTPGPEGIPLEAGAFLGSASTTTPGATVDGIRCQANEQVAYHIHAHLQVYFDGLPRALPGGIGIISPVPQQTPAGSFFSASQCYYWLHTHTTDGVIHVESPSQRIYTLGDFFDEWRQPLSSDRIANLQGRVQAIVNGKLWTKSPRDIPLVPHAQIQLSIGQPAPPYEPISWSGTSL